MTQNNNIHYQPIGRTNHNSCCEGSRLVTNRKSLISLIIGLVVGFCMAELFVFSSPNHEYNLYSGHQHGDVNDPHHSHDMLELSGPEQDVGGHHEHLFENRTAAEQLAKDVRVLCWIMTNPANHKKKARHVKRTWGPRCNKLIFMSSETDIEIDSVALPVKEGRNNLWAKTKEAFKYIYNNHLNDADWFLKADDDTYVVVENLRLMLYPHKPETPIYFGCRFKPFVQQGYMSGGAGYVLSKEAVKRLVEQGIPNKNKCRQDGDGSEDVEIGKCLDNVGVVAGDSRDSSGRGKFFPFVPEHHLIPGHTDKSFWYWSYIYYKTDEGLDCCSDYAISFHYIAPNQMYVLDYLIYHLRPYGIVHNLEPLPDKIAPDIDIAYSKNETKMKQASTKPKRKK